MNYKLGVECRLGALEGEEDSIYHFEFRIHNWQMLFFLRGWFSCHRMSR